MAAWGIRLDDLLSPCDRDFRFRPEEDGPCTWTDKTLREFVEKWRISKQRDGKQVDVQDAKRMRVEARTKPAAAASEAELAAYRVEAERARRNHDTKGEALALKKWLATGDPESADYYLRMCDQEAAARKLEDEDDLENEDWSDPEVVYANRFRKYWDYVWAGAFGSFEDTTLIPSMLYTDHPAPRKSAQTMPTLQIFSVNVLGIKDNLQWPLHVYGIVAARDFLDHNRNIIFSRARDNCQTITHEDSSLDLTGPTRAVVLRDPMHFEVHLKLKGAIESDDQDFSFLNVPYRNSMSGRSSHVINHVLTSKLCTLELTFGHIFRSVEATISVKVLGGSWPDGFQSIFAASTASIDNKEVLLLAFGDGKLPVTADGMIKLSRCVASVEVVGELKVSAVVRCQNDKLAVERDEIGFEPKEAGKSRGILKVASCEMEVIVAWSLLPFSPFPRGLRCDDGASSSSYEFISALL